MEQLFFHGTPQLETERLILRKLIPEDAEDVFAYALDGEVTRYMTWDTHKSIEEAKGDINYNLGRYERDEAGEWGIISKDTGRLIGAMGFASCDKGNKRAEMGYALARPYWGQGIMPEAVRRVLKFAFEEVGLNRIEACHFLPNEKSGRVMEKVGMTFEGIARERVFVKGRYWDVKQYAIIRSDWIRS